MFLEALRYNALDLNGRYLPVGLDAPLCLGHIVYA